MFPIRAGDYEAKQVLIRRTLNYRAAQQKLDDMVDCMNNHRVTISVMQWFAGIVFFGLIIASTALLFQELSKSDRDLQRPLIPLLTLTSIILFLCLVGIISALLFACQTKEFTVWAREASGRALEVFLGAVLVLITLSLLATHIKPLTSHLHSTPPPSSSTPPASSSGGVEAFFEDIPTLTAIFAPVIILCVLSIIKSIFWKTDHAVFWATSSLLFLVGTACLTAKLDGFGALGASHWVPVLVPFCLLAALSAAFFLYQLGTLCKGYSVCSSGLLLKHCVCYVSGFLASSLAVLALVILTEILTGYPILFSRIPALAPPPKAHHYALNSSPLFHLLFIIVWVAQGLFSVALCEKVGEQMVELVIGFMLGELR